MTDMDTWVSEAKSVEIGTVASMLNLVIKNGTARSVCPLCAGKKSFALTPNKGLFYCFQCEEGGDSITLVQKVLGVDFLAACQSITGKAPPRGQGKSITAAERAERDLKIATLRADRDRADAADRKRRMDTASGIWGATIRLSGTPIDYLKSRGLNPRFADGQLRTHTNLPHPDGESYPALVGRVADINGAGCGIWRIYCAPDGRGKAPVENAKLGLGATSGGAVRIGGIASEIGIAEGIETALACRQMIFADTGRLVPVWASLSTSGMVAVQLPEEIQSVRIYADADFEKLTKGRGKPSPGFEAAKSLAERLKSEGRHVVTSIPSPGNDWLQDLAATEAAA